MFWFSYLQANPVKCKNVSIYKIVWIIESILEWDLCLTKLFTAYIALTLTSVLIDLLDFCYKCNIFPFEFPFFTGKVCCFI
jgi:hypothetical protein